MAKYESLITIRGTVDDMTFRKTKEGKVVGKKTGPTREKVLTNPKFARTRRNAGELKLANKDAMLLRHALDSTLDGVRRTTLNGHVIGLLHSVSLHDTVNDFGSRCAAAGDVSKLTGFDFSETLSLATALPIKFEHSLNAGTGVMKVQIPSFIAYKRKSFPKEATHFRIVSCGAAVNFGHHQYASKIKASDLLPLSRKTPGPVCLEHQLHGGTGDVLIQVLGIQLYKVEKGEAVLVKGGAVRILEAVRMEEKNTGSEALRQKGNEENTDPEQITRMEDELNELNIETETDAAECSLFNTQFPRYREISIAFCLLIVFLSGLKSGYSQTTPKHFIFFSRDREGIHDSSFYLHPGITGAQITYPWRILEPSKDAYNFKEIEEDIAFLRLHGKKLFVQVQDVTFDSTRFNVPSYLLKDPVYNDGANAQYGFTPDGRPVKAGWVARRWDPAVAARFHLLLQQLARQFDGKIEGINLPETAVDLPEAGELRPPGFTRANYVAAIKQNMQVLKSSFKKSVPLLYANFMPGDSRSDSKADLEAVYQYARQIKLGMGGPDIKVYRPFQMANSYPLIRDMAGIAPTGVAVQEGNYSVINPKTGKPVTLPEIMDFATGYLKLSYIFWCTEEPYYRKEVLPMLRSFAVGTTH